MWMVLLDNDKTFEQRPVRREEAPEYVSMVKNRPTLVFLTEQSADHYATQLASENPTKPVYVFETMKVLETQKPKIHVKTFNERGELLPSV